ncbi:MAG: hypothetical protein ACRDZQ_07205 [Acidimicrobiales bacterium]
MLSIPSVAFAAGSGYGGPGPAPTGTGAFSSVVEVVTVQPSGGTVTVTVDGATITIVVPPGTFTSPVQVVITAGDLTSIGDAGVPGAKVIVAFGVQIDQNGTPVGGTFANPISVTVSDSSITGTSKVYELLTNGTYGAVPGATVGTGTAQVSFSSDPSFVILQPPAPPAVAPVSSSGPTATGAPIPGATTATTGKPFVTEGLVALGLVGLGGLGTWRLRRRRVAG